MVRSADGNVTEPDPSVSGLARIPPPILGTTWVTALETNRDMVCELNSSNGKDGESHEHGALTRSESRWR